MRINPEFQRNLWLEFSPARLIAMPLTLALLFYVFSSMKYNEAQVQVNEKTWDFQRLSSLSPMGLALGKLFGSTSYAWYGGLMALLVYIVTSVEYLTPYYLLCNTLLLLEAGVLCHAIALFSSLQSMQGITGGRDKIRSGGHHIAGFLIALNFFAAAASMSGATGLRYALSAHNVTWYDGAYNNSGFLACFGLAMVGWLLAGIHAQMRAHLQMRGLPWLWCGFVLFMMAFFAGFAVSGVHDMGNVQLAIAFMTSLFFFYVTAFTESWNVMSYRRMQNAWNKRQYRRAIALSPRWITAFAITLATAFFFTLIHLQLLYLGLNIMGLLLFAMRDVAILHYFRFSPTRRRVMAGTAFWLVLLYILLPMLFAAIRLPSLAGFLLPVAHMSITYPPFGLLISGMVQLCIVVCLAKQRWKRYWALPA
jgi:hypothetical protein